MSTIESEVQEQWSRIASIQTIRNERDYNQSMTRLNRLLDEVGTNESHPLYTLLDTLSIVLQSYEEAHHTIPDCSAAEVLSYLMEEHELSEVDLPELGEPAAVSTILSGKQALDIQQIRTLASRFSVSPSVFI